MGGWRGWTFWNTRRKGNTRARRNEQPQKKKVDARSSFLQEPAIELEDRHDDFRTKEVNVPKKERDDA
jgi:hypothetical protein